jgi:hypothetical protein
MVLVDPTGLNEFRDVSSILTDEERIERRTNFSKMREHFNLCVDRARKGVPVGAPRTECASPATGSDELDAALRLQFSSPKRPETLRSEMTNFYPPEPDGVESRITEQVRAKPFNLGDKPLIILRTGGRVPPGERGERLKALGAEENRRLASASTRGKLIPVDSGHVIQDDRPDVVISAVREVVMTLRTDSPLTTR